ncbi:unnamed protein product [Oppiella nova]|uniref:Uncharacterized protein n=1 Tax=Oppiella nova TaxID=334625 RepID=A0A7R9LIN0_9ACAR|nr:unnamed protein product [Oppiella nova]CAG2163961.1 unnamed protein product [Oppiella nova]
MTDLGYDWAIFYVNEQAHIIHGLQHCIESGHYKHMMFVYYILTHYNTKKSNNLIDDQLSKDCERLDNNVIREKDAKGLFTLLWEPPRLLLYWKEVKEHEIVDTQKPAKIPRLDAEPRPDLME